MEGGEYHDDAFMAWRASHLEQQTSDLCAGSGVERRTAGVVRHVDVSSLVNEVFDLI